MFHEVDTALRSWLRSGLPKDCAITFEAPNESGANQKSVNAFLHKVCQVPSTAVNWVGVRARDGRVIGRQPPVRHYRLWYLLTAWAASAAEEHELLGTTLATLALQDTIPLPHLTGSLLEADEPVPVTVADSEFSPAPVEIWSALRIPARSTLDLVVTMPLVPPLMTDLAPPPRRVEVEAESQRAHWQPGADDADAPRRRAASEHRARRLR